MSLLSLDLKFQVRKVVVYMVHILNFQVLLPLNVILLLQDLINLSLLLPFILKNANTSGIVP